MAEKLLVYYIQNESVSTILFSHLSIDEKISIINLRN